VVRGDAPGEYQLTANATGDIKFRGVSTTVPLNASSTSDPIKVYKPTLNVTYILPSYYEEGQTFELELKVTNSSPITLEGVTVLLKPAQMVNVHLASGEAVSKTVGTGTLKINETQTVKFNLVSEVQGCVIIPQSSVQTDPNLQPTLEFQPYALCPGAFSNCLGGCAGPTVGDPINPAIGNYFNSLSDLSLATAGSSYMNLEVVRTYNTLDKSIGLFGKGWRFSYDTKIMTRTNNTGNVIVVNPDGRQDVYVPTGGGNYQSPPRANANLVKDGNGFSLNRADQVKYVYNLEGRLDRIVDRNNNQLTLAYDSTSGALHTVSDNYGRILTFSINSNGRVDSVTDGTRTVSYGYDTGFMHLTSVTDPRGNTLHYGYDATSGLLNERRDQNNHLVMQNIYDSQNRVIQQNTFDGSGATYSIYLDYGSQMGTTVFTDTRSNRTIFTINPRKAMVVGQTNALGQSSSMVRDNNDDPIVITNTRGSVAYATYNPMGRPTNVTTTVKVDGTPQTIAATLY
jgi:YD repeat-containing protein